MDSKEGSKKKGISQDLLLDDFFKPPVEEEPAEPGKKEPEPKKKPSIKKDLMLDDFFSPPVQEEQRETPQKEVRKEEKKEEPESREKVAAKESTISTTYKQVKKTAPPPVMEKTPPPEEPVTPPEPPPVPPPPQRSLRELLEEPIFETKPKPATPSPKIPTPAPSVTPRPVVTPAPGVGEARKFPVVPVIGGIVVVLAIGAGAFIFLSVKGKEPASPARQERVEEVRVEVPESPPAPEEKVEQPVQKESEPISEQKSQPEVQQPVAKVELPEEKPAVVKTAPPVKAPEQKQVVKINRFMVVAGPYSTMDEAKAGEIKFKVLGYTPKITTTSVTIETYTVFIDPPMPEAEANVARLKLSLKGFSPELLDADGNKKVKVGTYSTLGEAIEKKNQVQELGYTTTIDIGKTTGKGYNVEIGFPESSPAQEAIDKLKGLGIDAKMVEKKG